MSNKGLPSRAGKPNYTAIANSCGFDRKAFYGQYKSNREARSIINQAIIDVGLDSEIAVDSGDDFSGQISELEKKLSTAVREVQKLERDLALSKESTNYWKHKAKDLEERLQQFSKFEVMATTGRRFIP